MYIYIYIYIYITFIKKITIITNKNFRSPCFFRVKQHIFLEYQFTNTSIRALQAEKDI